MATRIIKNRQTSIDATILTYGRQDALFQIHEDNEGVFINSDNEVNIPAVLEPGMTIEYDETNELYDLNQEKVRSRETVEIATLANEQFGTFDNSFDESFAI